MKIAIIGLLFLTLSLPAATFNVRDFGATGDGHTLDTAAIQKALNACENTGGTVEFPSGTYLSQPLTVRTRSTIQLDAGATLQAVTNQSDFMKIPGDWLKAKTSGDFVPFIKGSGLSNVVFTGSGTIDGNGSVWWGEVEKARQIKPGLYAAAAEFDRAGPLCGCPAGKSDPAKLAEVSFCAWRV